MVNANSCPPLTLGDDHDFVAVGDDSREPADVAAVVIVHENVDVLAHCAALVHHAVAQAEVGGPQRGQRRDAVD